MTLKKYNLCPKWSVKCISVNNGTDKQEILQNQFTAYVMRAIRNKRITLSAAASALMFMRPSEGIQSIII